MDGTSSSDPDGVISSFLWKKILGPSTFSISTPSDATTEVENLLAGLYLFELEVTDSGGLSAKDTIMVTVKDPSQANRPPVINAGRDQTFILPANSMDLDGSASSDPDNNIASYLWVKISGPSYTII